MRRRNRYQVGMRSGRLLLATALCAVGSLWVAPIASATGLELIANYTSPVFVTSDPSNANRVFVVEQGGGSNPPRIQLTQGGTTTTFLDASLLTSPGVVAGGEQGLLSMAFAPDYASSNRLYVFYTGTDGGALHVDEFTASGDDVDVATRRPVITIPHPTYNNHNGGQLQFGPDGYLYISTGDGGSGGDPDENAQNVDSLLGKILRIAPTPGGGYTVPDDNPFAGATPGAGEVWSYGLRNPWRFSFDRLTGALSVGDVGQGNWEEIDYDPPESGAGRGDNFGWDCREGAHDYETTGCSGLTFTEPMWEYANPPSAPAAVVGGYVVRDPEICELYGRYVYSDTYAGVVRSLIPGTPTASDDRSEGLPVSLAVSFGEDAAGRVYVVSLTGPVYRLIHSPGTQCPSSPQPPTPSPDPQGDSVAPNLTLDGEDKQAVRDRTVSLEAVVDETAQLNLGAVVVKGSRNKQLFELPDQVAQATAGVEQPLSFNLSRREARIVKNLIRDQRRITIRVEGTATDAAGNRGLAAEFAIRLLRD